MKNIEFAVGAKKSTRWSPEQTSILVQEWKERVDEVEDSKSLEAWDKILAALNKEGHAKTLKQCKDRIWNLKEAYKDAKGNNANMGRGVKRSLYFDIFDQVLGSRPVVRMTDLEISRTNSAVTSSIAELSRKPTDFAYPILSPKKQLLLFMQNISSFPIG